MGKHGNQATPVDHTIDDPIPIANRTAVQTTIKGVPPTLKPTIPNRPLQLAEMIAPLQKKNFLFFGRMNEAKANVSGTAKGNIRWASDTFDEIGRNSFMPCFSREKRAKLRIVQRFTNIKIETKDKA